MSDLGWIDAAVLVLVEGLTEYLPVSSTGHLLVASRLLGLGGDGRTERALDTYAICIQSGAILAVLVLYRHRTAQLVQGAVGRSPGGRRILVALAVAFAPAAVTGFLAGDTVKSLLFGVVPVAVAWMAGGLFILGTRDRKSVVEGKSVSVRVDLGGRRIIKKKNNEKKRDN